VIKLLREEGVGTKYLQRKPGLGGYGVVINYQAERTILSYYGVPTGEFLSEDEDVDASWVYLTTGGGSYEEFYRKAVDWTVKKGVKLAFNPGTWQVKAGDALKYVYEKTDLLFVNKEEATIVLSAQDSGFNIKDLLRGLHEWGAKIVVITDGPEGTYCFDGSNYLYMPIVPAPVVERTGAGDAFGAGFMAAILSGKNVEEALKWGTCDSGSVLGFVGPEAGLLTKDQMPQWLEKAESVKVEKI
jgi:sugar/nucleoside kinase (ribokinase family)